MTPDDLCFTPATQLAPLYRRRKVSPLEVTEAVLARIQRVNPVVNAYCTVAADEARRDAHGATAALRRGARLGPLHGVPVSIKDITPTRGIRTTSGSKLYEHHVPVADALIVERLRAAGAIVLGKTNTPEFALGGTTTNAVFGVTRNPWNPSLTPGGSTGGGAAAVAAGLGQLAQGSDLGGSLRVPASFCGVVALRPSPGLVPVFPRDLAWDTYGVQGPMARTVGDVALMLAAIAGRDSRSPISYDVDPRVFVKAARAPSARGLRVAWSTDLGLFPVDPEIGSIVSDAARVFRTLGARVDETHPDLGGVLEVIRVGRAAQLAAGLGPMLAERRDQLPKEVVAEVEWGLGLRAVEVGRVERLRTALWLRLHEFLSRYDLLLTPTTPVPAFPVDIAYPALIDGKPVGSYFEWFLLTYAFSVLAVPAMSVPCGFTQDGLPVGLQIVGRAREETTVLRAAAAFESEHGGARRPPV